MTVPVDPTVPAGSAAPDLPAEPPHLPPRRRRPWWRRLLGGLWRALDGLRRLAGVLLVLALIGLVVGGWYLSRPKPLPDGSTLVLDLKGELAEERPGGTREALAARLGDDGIVRLRDVAAVLDAAARDPAVVQALLQLDDLGGGGLPAQREVAAAVARFRAAGKPVYAWGRGYDQRQYRIAVAADRVLVHPLGTVAVSGLGGRRTYLGDALRRVGIEPHVIRVGSYKNAAETIAAAGPSPETRESEGALLRSVWSVWTADVETARKLPAGTVDRLITGLPASFAEAGGSPATWARLGGLVDGLVTRDALETLLRERGTVDADTGAVRRVGWREYLGRVTPREADGPGVAVIVAEGMITDGEEPGGRVGGTSTAERIRRAVHDEAVKAVVLRVNSPGGSPLGSELVRRELELARAAGKPVVVSMGDVAASGGYWVSLAADEVIADPATITGSIGVVALLPTAERLMDRLSLRADGEATSWLRTAYDPRTGLDPRFATLLQTLVDRTYRDFTGLAAKARGVEVSAIEANAKGRVWSGAQALERRLIDRTGGLDDALAAARSRARLPDDAPVRWIEQPPSTVERLAARFGARVIVDALRAEVAASRTASGIGALAAGRPELLAAMPMLPAAVVRDLGWLVEAARTPPGTPPQALIHCLCTDLAGGW